MIYHTRSLYFMEKSPAKLFISVLHDFILYKKLTHWTLVVDTHLYNSNFLFSI